jgi:hypothetical protein
MKNSRENDTAQTKLDHDRDLDVPGAEMDDDDEIYGNEDEENNFYSLGGDEKN